MRKFLSGVLALCILMTIVFCGCGEKQETEAAFVKPEGYVSVVQVSINPTVNLYLDADKIILAVEYVNADAKECYAESEEELVGSSIDSGINIVIKAAAEAEYFADNKTVTIDVLETKEETEKATLLTAVVEKTKTVITDNNIGADVVLTESAQKVVDDKAAADKATADKEAAEKAAAEKAAEEKAAAEKAAAEKAAAEKAAAEKAAAEKAAAEKALKNPQKSLKKGQQYSIHKPEQGSDELLTRIKITFKDNGEYSYGMAPYLCDEFGEGEFIIYNGKKYYLSGGGGGGGTYTLTDEKITLEGGLNMVFTMTTDGKLVVHALNESSNFFVVGDTLSIQ